MSNEILHDNLDDFLKKSFEGHTIIPGDELWASIEPQLNVDMVPHAKYVRMKYAFIATAASLVAVVFLLFTQTSSVFNSKNQNNLSITENSGLTNPVNTVLDNLHEKSNISDKKLTASETKNTSYEKRELTNNPDLVGNSNRPTVVSSSQYKEIPLSSTNEICPSESIDVVEVDPIECREVNSGEEYTVNSTLTLDKKPIAKSTKPGTNKSSWSINFPKIDLGSLTFSGRRPLNRLYGDRNKGIFDLSEFMKKVEVGFNYSPLLSSRTLGKNSITENGKIDHQYFNDIEKALLTNNFGLDLMYRVNDRWSFRTGLYFTQYRHETQNDALHRDVISSDQIILNTSAGKIPVSGTGMDQLPSPSVFNTRIDLSYLEIPLVARYYWDSHFFTDAGVNYSYLKSTKTSITTEEYAGTFSYSDLEGIQKQNFALSLGFGLDYKLSSRFKFEIGPEVNWQVNSFSTNGMNTHPLYWGIRAGIRFKWRNPGYKI